MLSEGVCSFEVNLNSFVFAHFFELFTGIWYVGNNNGGLGYGFVCGGVVVGRGVGGVVRVLLGIG